MKMKNTMISDHCNNIDPLSAVVSTETSVTSGLSKNIEKKKKKTFFSKVKAIFSKSSTEAQKNVSIPFHNAVKNTYVVRENHGTCSHDLQIYRQFNDEVNSENNKIYYGVNVALTGNQKINSVLMNDNNLLNPTNENMDSVYPSTKNNSWITTSTNTSQGVETNGRDIFTKQTTFLPSPVDVGVQTKIPSCYKVYLLHKHVSNCNRKNKSHSKIKKKIFINRDKNKSPRGNKSYCYYKYSSTESIYTDESHSGDVIKGKHRRKNKENDNKNVFNKSMRYCETNNTDIQLLGRTEKFSRCNEIINIDSNSNIIIYNNDRTRFSETVSNSRSSSFDSAESQKLKYRKTKVNYKTKKRETNEPYKKEGTNAEDSQSKSLPSLNLFRKNKISKQIKCNSSPLVNQNSIQTKIVKKKESIKTTFVNTSGNSKEIKNTVLQLFRNFHEKNNKDYENINKKKQLAYKTTNISSEEELSSDSENSNSNFIHEIKETQEINNPIKIKAKGNQISENNELNKLKIKHANSNSTITIDTQRTIKSSIRNYNLKLQEYNADQNDEIKTKQNHTYEQNDHSVHANSDNLKLNRRPIITHPMIFFNENSKSETESGSSNYYFNKSFIKKEKKARDVNMKLIKNRKFINSYNNLKIPLEQPHLNPSMVNCNNTIMRNAKKYADSATINGPKKKIKNHKNKNDMRNSTCPLRNNKQKFGNSNKKNVNNPLNIETNSYVCGEGKHIKKSNARFYKYQDPHCILHRASSKKNQQNKYTSWKPSSHILKTSNLTEISFESNLQKNLFHKHKQVNKKTQKNWNENYSGNNKSNLEKKFSKNFNQERRIFQDILAEKLFPKNFSSNVGVHGAFSGNITSKRKTFFAKLTPILTTK